MNARLPPAPCVGSRLGWLGVAAALHALPAWVFQGRRVPIGPGPRPTPIEVTMRSQPAPMERPVEPSKPKEKLQNPPPPVASKPKRRRPRATARERHRRASPTREAGPKRPAAPRPVVGMSFGSTVRGGPAFATGETLIGSTPSTGRAEPAAAPPPPRGSGNRQARFVNPTGPDVERPRRTGRIKPNYPEALRAQRVEAQVTVQLMLNRAGAVTRVRIMKPARHPAFNRAALEAAQKEEFTPATQGGRPIPYTLSFSYRFRSSD